jgi:hypothetical protein
MVGLIEASKGETQYPTMTLLCFLKALDQLTFPQVGHCKYFAPNQYGVLQSVNREMSNVVSQLAQ